MLALARCARSCLMLLPLVLGACAAGGVVHEVVESAETRLNPEVRAMYGARWDGDILIPAVPAQFLPPENRRRIVNYWTDEAPGTIVIDPWTQHLYYVLGDDRAVRYRVGVGEQGRKFTGRATIPFKREWPTWTPTPRMLREEPEVYEPWRAGMPGGLDNPLGARALYLYRNGRDTLYRIHGTHAPWSVGEAVSSGCIRLFNQDAIDLYDRVDPGTRVVVLSEREAGKGTVPPAGILLGEGV
jgi:lipoprotein-anchoring transpeptidase ErfK/SrfK